MTIRFKAMRVWWEDEECCASCCWRMVFVIVVLVVSNVTTTVLDERDTLCVIGDNSVCHMSQKCTIVEIIQENRTIARGVCYCCKTTNSSTTNWLVEDCDKNYSVDITGNCVYRNESFYENATSQPSFLVTTPSLISNLTTNQVETWIVSVASITSGLVLLFVIIAIVRCCRRHKGSRLSRLCRNVLSVDDPEEDDASSMTTCTSHATNTIGTQVRGCSNLYCMQDIPVDQKYQTKTYDDFMLQSTFQFLFPSVVPEIDKDCSVSSDSDGNCRKDESWRKPSLETSVEQSALATIVLSDANWSTFHRFCAILDAATSRQMMWSNVAADLGYTSSDIFWISQTHSRSNSLTFIQDFLGRTPSSKSETAFTLLHSAVAETDNKAALDVLEMIEIVNGNGCTTTVGKVAVKDEIVSCCVSDDVENRDYYVYDVAKTLGESDEIGLMLTTT